MQHGTLYGISVGPGDRELITIKALRLLQQAAVVAFPAGTDNKLGLAQEIILPWLSSNQKQLPLSFPYTRDDRILLRAWEKAAKTVWEHLKVGENVAFACLGDLSLYGTFTYLAFALQQFAPTAKIEIIPGVCSPLAATAILGIPLAVRQDRLAIVPALDRVKELETIVQWADVLVLMKVNSVYPEVWHFLQERDLLDRSWVVERATMGDGKIYSDLRSSRDLKLSYFSLLIVRVRELI
ncbi:MAG: precorrin-2 C(20)-methyltransferase [Prochloraceae cyanobacterium]